MRNGIRIAVLAALFFLIQPCYTRTDGEVRYFPLHVGDSREYVFDHDPEPDFFITESVPDSVVINGKKYYILRKELYNSDTVRTDADGNILRFRKDHEYLWFDFTADSGATYLCEYAGLALESDPEYLYTVEVRKYTSRETPMGVFENCVEFSFDVPEIMDEDMIYVFAPHAGRVIMENNGWLLFQMTRAVINGRVYATADDFNERTALEQDSLALTALFDATGGPAWTKRDNWLTGPLNTWFGVTVNEDRVVSLDLRNNNLTGILPDAIGDLTALKKMILRDNRIEGGIPAGFWNLTHLEDVRLSGNRLTGTLPPEIGNLTRLDWLTLYSNQLSGPIPPEIGRLTSMTHLYLRDNQFTGSIPVELGNCTLLKELFLEGNRLTGTIPPALGNLTSCYRLSLSDNHLTGPIPSELGACVSMEELNLGENRLEGGIPAELGNLAELYDLTLGDNELTGEIPPSLFNSPHLRTFKLNNNRLEGLIPETISDCTTLERVYLQSNRLSGPVPEGLVNADSLLYLFLNDNRFTGMPDLSSLRALRQTFVHGNRLTFEDLEPNIGIRSFSYAPQDSVGVETDTTVEDGRSLALSVEVGGTANLYQWFKNGSVIAGATGSIHEIAAAGASDEGDYVCRITNAIVPDLTLFSRPVHVSVVPDVGVADSFTGTPRNFELHPSFPNPFNPETTLRYSVKESCRVRLTVCDLSGRVVAEPVNEVKQPGKYEARFNGSGLASGVYLCKIRMKDFTDVQKITLMR